MDIRVTSSTFASQVLDAVRPLVTAYFPAATVRVVEPGVFRNDEMRQQIEQTEQTVQTELTERRGMAIEAETFRLTIETAWGYECGLVLRWQELGCTDRNQGHVVRLSEAEIQQIMVQPEVGREEPVKVFLKHGVAKLLSEVTGRVLPWGILTGIRPTKLVHRLRDLQMSSAQQTSVLHDRYGIRADKIELLQAIGQAQEPYLAEMENNPQAVAVYIGIPFCPTRCTYCSFPAYLLGRERSELEEYMEALRAEIVSVGAKMRELGLWAETLYIGGGTPTILTAEEMSGLLEHALARLPHADLEFTVEAGRPDTLNEEKLRGLKAWGVNRISINPQTMQERTLLRIGRAHDVASVEEIFGLARQVSDWVINMDLILGLPGEEPADVQQSLERLDKLRPDNLTIHALALKRGSREKEMGYSHQEAERIENMAEMARKAAHAWGLRPYYLYRQKQIAGNLENIGYARAGRECRYNIAIMEERQHVIGIGAGAASKIIDFQDYSLQNLQHPSNWRVYVRRWAELDQQRWSRLKKS